MRCLCEACCAMATALPTTHTQPTRLPPNHPPDSPPTDPPTCLPPHSPTHKHTHVPPTPPHPPTPATPQVGYAHAPIPPPPRGPLPRAALHCLQVQLSQKDLPANSVRKYQVQGSLSDEGQLLSLGCPTELPAVLSNSVSPSGWHSLPVPRTRTPPAAPAAHSTKWVCCIIRS